MRKRPRTTRGPGPVRARRRTSRDFRPELLGLEPRLALSGANPFEPTADEQYMLELINQARANPAAEGQRLLALARTDPVLKAATAGWDLNRFDQVISAFGPEPPLAFNTNLIEAARAHDAAMLAVNGQFHSPPGYLTDPQVAHAANGQAYYPTGTSYWDTGENIFAFSANVDNSNTANVVNYFEEAFLLDWGNPDFGHLKNLLAPGPAEAPPGVHPYSEVGIGLLTNVAPANAPLSSSPDPANQGLNVGPDLVTQEFGWLSGHAFLTGVVFNNNDGSGFFAPGEGARGVTIQAVGRNGQGTFSTQTWGSGGYTLALPPGTFDVTASGNLAVPRATTVTIGSDNVGWDVASNPPAVADQPVPGHYLGNASTDLAVYRASTAQWFLNGLASPISFGAPGLDLAMPGDYDGVGHTEIAVYRPTTAQWFVAGHAQGTSFGAPGLDVPMPGDYDGVGHTEIAVYRPTTAQWFIAGHSQPISFGAPGLDVPGPGDYDGVGHTEIAVYRPTTAEWFVAGHGQPIGFGEAGLDVPVRGEFDGGGRAEPAVFRPTTGQWFLADATGGARVVAFGQGGVNPPVTGWLGGVPVSVGSALTGFLAHPAARRAGPGQGPEARQGPVFGAFSASGLRYLSKKRNVSDFVRSRSAPPQP